MNPVEPPPEPVDALLHVALYGGLSGIVLVLLGVLGNVLLLIFLGVMVGVGCVVGGLYLRHQTEERRHQRELERTRALNEPARVQAESYATAAKHNAEAAFGASHTDWLQSALKDVTRDILGHQEASRVREHEIDKQLNDHLLQLRMQITELEAKQRITPLQQTQEALEAMNLEVAAIEKLKTSVPDPTQREELYRIMMKRIAPK